MWFSAGGRAELGSWVGGLEIKTPLFNLESLRQAFSKCHVAFGPLERSCVGSEGGPPHSGGCTG